MSTNGQVHGGRDFRVPDLGEGLEDATLSSWSVAVGDHVELNQTLCTVETAKAEVEIPSPYAGRVVELGGEVGDVLPVGALLVRIDDASIDDAGRGSSPVEEVRDSDTSPPEPVRHSVKRNPVLVGYGADADGDSSRRNRPDRARAKPAVRKLASELLVDINGVEPGADGLVSREAVLTAAGVRDQERSGISHDLQPVRGVHAEMARRMTLSRREIPDAHAGVQVDGTRLLALRDTLGLTPFVLTLRLLVLALTHHRVLNSTWVDDAHGAQVQTHHAVHLGVATAAPRGLLVPVVRDAQTLTTRELSEVVSRLIESARAGTLKPTELQGSTFTVSNFGALGLDEGVPVINHPEAAILGIGSLKPRAVVVEGEVVARSTMSLTCAFDHRVADGAQVAAFLTELRALIESPETALLDL